jgi:hypothetical protein
MAETLKERGWFWWADKPIPPNQLAPAAYVAGTLTIDKDGRIEIELDGELRSSDRQAEGLSNSDRVPLRNIAGLLKSENRYILAYDAYRSGMHWSTDSISYHVFSAQICLISPKPLSSIPRVWGVRVDLDGYREWLRLRAPKHEMTKRRLALSYARMPDIRYSSTTASISISSDLRLMVHGQFGSRGKEILETITFRFRSKSSVDLRKAITTFVSIQDFFIIVTGSEFRLGWPTLELTTNQTCTMYFPTSRGGAEAPKGHECVTSFPQIKERFGAIFFDWFAKREALGPGFYLYLSTRRGGQMYEEQRFTSLISGLETFHRMVFNDPRSSADEARINRILESIGNKADQKWLRGRTKQISAPPLSQRLRELLSPVAINIQSKEFNNFCDSSAGVRNELFHHGRSKKADNHEYSLQYINSLSSLLGYLYHARIMIEIGVPIDLVKAWMTKSPDSYRINFHMIRAGLRITPKNITR